MLQPPGFYYVKKPKRFVILSSDKSSKRNLSSFFDIKILRRIEHLQSEEPFSLDPYFSSVLAPYLKCMKTPIYLIFVYCFDWRWQDMAKELIFQENFCKHLDILDSIPTTSIKECCAISLEILNNDKGPFIYYAAHV